MEKKLRIKITIAGRIYPLSINNATEEEGMRKAANRINKMVAMFEKNYAVSDKQDVLAMSALQFASQVEIHELSKENILEEATEKLNALSQKLDSHLE
ncbi:MAG: cell division protein ZapA [Flavobacteriaceae bacterium]|nr:MAG: cell division protein ZapA [Flavobacteriaceae bacterium]